MNNWSLSEASEASNKALDNIGKAKLKPKSTFESAQRLINKVLKWIAILFLPAFFVVILFFVTVIAVEHWLSPVGYQNMLSNLHVQAGTNSFIGDVLKAIESVIYMIFIHPILWLLDQFSRVIYFIGGGSLSNKILFNNSNNRTAGIPTEYWVVFMIAVGLIFIFLGLKLIMVIAEQQNIKGKQIRRTIQVFFLIILALALIPIVFFFINTLINLITKIVIEGTKGGQNIGLIIFNNSFNNGLHHFTSVPDSFSFKDSSNFNYIICLFSEGFMVYVFLLIIMNLFTRVFELFLFYCISPLVVVSTIVDTSGSYPYLRNWINLTTQRFLLFTFIFLAYNIFLNAINLFSDIATKLPHNQTQPIFVLLGILGAGIVCVKTPSLLSAIVGGKASLIDSIGHLSSLTTATGGIAAGAGLLGAAIFGSKQSRFNRSQSLETNNFLRTSGGAVGLTRGTVSGLVSTTGAIRHPSRFIRYLGGGIAGAATGVGAFYAAKYKKMHKDKSLAKPAADSLQKPRNSLAKTQALKRNIYSKNQQPRLSKRRNKW